MYTNSNECAQTLGRHDVFFCKCMYNKIANLRLQLFLYNLFNLVVFYTASRALKHASRPEHAANHIELYMEYELRHVPACERELSMLA